VTDREHKASEWSDEAMARAFAVGLPDYLFYLIVQVSRRRDASLASALAKVDMTVSKWRALAVVGRLGECAMSELAAFSVVDRTTLTRTVDQLVAEGLVERFPSPADRRLVLLRLTDRGQDVAARCRSAANADNRRHLRGLSDEKVRAAVSALIRIADNVIDEPDDAAYAILTFGEAGREG
jgi:DNA-binding MarR family transcriptional regulator